MAAIPVCTVDGCGKRALSLGMCSSHYQRYRRGTPLDAPPKTKDGTVLAFLLDALTVDTDECIPWPFGRSSKGYGRVWFKGKLWISSRLACTLVHGEPPTPDHEAAHSCGKGHLGCINKRHLRWATSAENHADMVRHGTCSPGPGSKAIRGPEVSKLTTDQVLSIRSRLEAGERIVHLAPEFGVSQACIQSIRRGDSWGWLLGAPLPTRQTLIRSRKAK